MSTRLRTGQFNSKDGQDNPGPSEWAGPCRIAADDAGVVVHESADGTAATTSGRRLPRLTSEQRDLVARHLGLVGVHLRTRVPTPRQPTRHREYDDLFQQGCVALARAAAQYRPERDGVFAAYALPRIRGAVHNAIYDLFTVVHVPARAIQQARERGESTLCRPPFHVQEMTSDITRKMTTTQAGGQEDSLRHVMHRRFEIAVHRALEQMRSRVWRHRNPTEIMTRIAYERMLIDDERLRTPLRQIAREANVSSGRACDYEKNLLNAVAAHFERDPQVRALVEMAQEDEAGWDERLDASRQDRLVQAEIGEFEARFVEMAPPARAEILYSLIERSSQCIPEVARNLFRLTLRMEDDPVRTVA
jgi:RNA polymerase sigma factor (sigma-70 family)